MYVTGTYAFAWQQDISDMWHTLRCGVLYAGEWRSEMTARIPTEQLPPDTKLKAGDNVRLSNGTSAVVRESSAESVLLDFNHPMAGKALTFEVELLKLTKVGLVFHSQRGVLDVPGIISTPWG